MKRHQRTRRKVYSGRRRDRENRGAIHRRRAGSAPEENKEEDAIPPATTPRSE